MLFWRVLLVRIFGKLNGIPFFAIVVVVGHCILINCIGRGSAKIIIEEKSIMTRLMASSLPASDGNYAAKAQIE